MICLPHLPLEKASAMLIASTFTLVIVISEIGNVSMFVFHWTFIPWLNYIMFLLPVDCRYVLMIENWWYDGWLKKCIINIMFTSQTGLVKILKDVFPVATKKYQSGAVFNVPIKVKCFMFTLHIAVHWSIEYKTFELQNCKKKPIKLM